jgi:hypothetical protein
MIFKQMRTPTERVLKVAWISNLQARRHALWNLARADHL